MLSFLYKKTKAFFNTILKITNTCYLASFKQNFAANTNTTTSKNLFVLVNEKLSSYQNQNKYREIICRLTNTRKIAKEKLWLWQVRLCAWRHTCVLVLSKKKIHFSSQSTEGKSLHGAL
jgi:hypothetical protein